MQRTNDVSLVTPKSVLTRASDVNSIRFFLGYFHQTNKLKHRTNEVNVHSSLEYRITGHEKFSLYFIMKFC